MKLLHHSSLFALLAALTSFALAEEAPKTDGKMPPIKVDPSPLPQVAGTLTTIAPVVEKVAPSVVTISTSKMVARRGENLGQNPMLNDPMFRRFFGIPEDEDAPAPGNRRRGGGANEGGNAEGKKRLQKVGLGSGVIVSAEGHILTNNHVIDGADEILVTLGNEKQEYKAKKIGTDSGTDIAVLQIEATKLRPIVFADSDKLRVGDLAIAVGNPFGLTQSVTMGIISALGRNVGITDYESFIQTDASINQGNSGGALVDTEGRLIGINTAIFSRTGGNQGIGFAVPANLAHSIMESIMKSGRVSRGYLGIALQALDDDLAAQFKAPSTAGALVSGVEAKSPSEKAGILAGDVVVEVEGKKVAGPSELRLLVAAMLPGTKVNVKLWRDGKEKTLSVTLAERPGQKIASADVEKPSDDPDVLDGVTVGDLDAELRKKFDIPESVKSGVVVTAIDAESPSAEAGVRVGDVILEVKGQAIATAKDAVELSEKLKKEKKVLLRVASKGASRFVIVERKE